MNYFLVFVKTRNGWGGRVRYRHLVAAETPEAAQGLAQERYGPKVKIHVEKLKPPKDAGVVMTQCSDYLMT